MANTVVLTGAAPGYAPDGRALVVVDRARGRRAVPEAVLRRELARIYARADRRLGRTCTPPRSRDALPAFPAGRPVRRPVELGDGLFVAGDHRDTPSTQGALVSGRRAAEAVLAHLGA